MKRKSKRATEILLRFDCATPDGIRMFAALLETSEKYGAVIMSLNQAKAYAASLNSAIEEFEWKRKLPCYANKPIPDFPMRPVRAGE